MVGGSPSQRSHFQLQSVPVILSFRLFLNNQWNHFCCLCFSLNTKFIDLYRSDFWPQAHSFDRFQVWGGRSSEFCHPFLIYFLVTRWATLAIRRHWCVHVGVKCFFHFPPLGSLDSLSCFCSLVSIMVFLDWGRSFQYSFRIQRFLPMSRSLWKIKFILQRIMPFI